MKPRALPHRSPPPSEAEMQLLVRRAARLRERPAEETETQNIAVAEFPAGGERFGVEMRFIVAALPVDKVCGVPLAPAHVVGIVRHEGEVLLVVSLAALIESEGWSRDPEVLLVIEADGLRLAIDCEEVARLTVIPARAIDAARPSRRGLVSDLEVDGRRLHLVDVKALVARVGAHAP
jgi:chemotaxis signal transduction protein